MYGVKIEAKRPPRRKPTFAENAERLLKRNKRLETPSFKLYRSPK